ncbi:MAG: hypothetical protein LBJ98_01390 [Endomicrobium sp.]|jgi:hypothetical protein|nr:hypothetical protein [Endomicrobium sp.]
MKKVVLLAVMLCLVSQCWADPWDGSDTSNSTWTSSQEETAALLVPVPARTIEEIEAARTRFGLLEEEEDLAVEAEILELRLVPEYLHTRVTEELIRQTRTMVGRNLLLVQAIPLIMANPTEEVIAGAETRVRELRDTVRIRRAEVEARIETEEVERMATQWSFGCSVM